MMYVQKQGEEMAAAEEKKKNLKRKWEQAQLPQNSWLWRWAETALDDINSLIRPSDV
jgi:hypothetical protein